MTLDTNAIIKIKRVSCKCEYYLVQVRYKKIVCWGAVTPSLIPGVALEIITFIIQSKIIKKGLSNSYRVEISVLIRIRQS